MRYLVKEAGVIPVISGKQRKRLREKKYQRKLRLISKGQHRCMAPAIRVVKDRRQLEEYEDRPARYKRSYCPRNEVYLRKLSNRIVRRKKDVLSGGGYRKCFDYQWTIY